jgi:hypothetical protein
VTSKFQPPTDDQVKEVLRRIPTPQLRRAFFEGLKNPLWVVPLAKEGVFGNPPDPKDAGDGLVRDVYWPEIDYLIRVAPDVPEAVVDVLLKLGKSSNSWVRRGAFSIGATVPADQAARLEPLIKSWKSTGLGWRTDPRELVAVAINLLQGGQTEVGTWFAGLIFKPFRLKDRRKPGTVIQDYWYELGLPELVGAIGDNGLAVVLPWLLAYEHTTGNLKRGADFTYLSRESIRSRGNNREDVEQALIDAVRDLAIRAMGIDAPGAKETLLHSNMLLGRKIALFALGEAIRQVDKSDQRVETLLAVAGELLFDERSSHYSCRIDYAELARAVAHISPETLDPLPQFIEQGWQADGNRLRERMSRDGADDVEIDEQTEEYGDGWKHSWLSAIGVEALPAQLGTTLAGLDSKYGVIDAPLEPTPLVTRWTGPNSPISQDEMAAMSPTELISHLESWHDSGDGWGPEPTHEGQGRELTALLTTNPRAVAGVSELVNRLRPTYVRALLSGWEAAVKANLEPDWTQVTEVTTSVLEHSDASTSPTEGGHGDDDADFRYSKQVAVRLLEQLVKPNATLAIPEESMSRFAGLIIASAADEAAWDEYIADTDNRGMDALTTSLNWQWPIRIRGLIYLMARGKDTSWYESARSVLETELSRVDTRGASRAAVGEGLGRLLSVDSEWLKPRVPQLFGSDVGLSAQQQIALTTAITVHHYHSKIYELLASSMIGAIRSEQPILSGWRTEADPLQRIGEWIITAIILGNNTVDDATPREFFAVAPPDTRGEALGRIAWAFMHAQRVDDPTRDRLAELWDSRVAHVRAHPDDGEELSGFYWFVRSHKFATEWWLPRLKEAAELYPPLSAECYLIAEEIASAADVDPRTTLDVLKLLLGERDESGMVTFELTREAAPIIIAKAIASGEQDLKQDAVAYMNQLGEQGNLSLESEVSKFLVENRSSGG